MTGDALRTTTARTTTAGTARARTATARTARARTAGTRPGARGLRGFVALVLAAVLLAAAVVTALVHPRAVTEADGLLPDGVSAFDVRYPGVTQLDPALLRALRRATADAADDGTALVVNSGWRSRRHQERLRAEAVARHGSQEAARWVATADTSAHVTGDAVDVGPAAAAAWLSGHGARYGLCRVYRNEPWHFELRPRAVEEGCPPLHADPAHDPRVRR